MKWANGEFTLYDERDKADADDLYRKCGFFVPENLRFMLRNAKDSPSAAQ